MNMVFDPTNDERLAIKIVQYSTNVMVQFIANRFVAQEWAAVFGGENRMNQDF